MGVFSSLFGKSPFPLFVEHTKKVHEVVKYVRPLVEALLAEDYDRIEALYQEVAKKEHEADIVKSQIRETLPSRYFMSVSRESVLGMLKQQDDVADAAQDFSVVLSLRRTKVHPELHTDLRRFAEQVIKVSEHLLILAEELTNLAETGFTGQAVATALEGVEKVGREEYEADLLQRDFARHYYSLEKELDPVTIMMYDKICHTLSAIANKAENAAKHLRLLLLNR